MPKAYVGVASQHGLTVLQPERDDTLYLVERSVRAGRRVGFWAVLGDADARSVQILFRSGHRREALVLLDRCAKDFGCIVPSDPRHPRLH